MSEQVVAKFGGTSMAQPEVVAGLAEANPEQRVVVVSAPGVDAQTPEKMTQTLFSYYDLVETGKDQEAKALRNGIIDRFDGLYEGMLGSSDRKDLKDFAAKYFRHASTKAESFYASLGELLSGMYFARAIGRRCLEPAVRFDESGSLDRQATRQAIAWQMNKNKDQVVVPGYYGTDRNRNIHLLGRGGSDRTGALYASSQEMDYQNWTDVSGIYSADPRVVPNAIPIPELTREEVREGAHGGSGVLQGDTIVDLNGSDSVVYLKNTNQPNDPGSRIVPRLTERRRTNIVGVSGRDDLTQINIKDMGMADQENYVAKVLVKLGMFGLSFEHLPASQDSFSITLHRNDNNTQMIDDFTDWVQTTHSGPNSKVNVRSAGVVHVVGEGLRDEFVRQAATIRILGYAARKRMTAMPIANTDNPSIAFMVEPSRVDEFLRTIHASEIESGEHQSY